MQMVRGDHNETRVHIDVSLSSACEAYSKVSIQCSDARLKLHIEDYLAPEDECIVIITLPTAFVLV